MYRLFVSDFDGTLLDSDEAIPLSTMVEIDRIRRDGVKFAVASDRILKSVLDYNRDFPFLDYVISCDGAYVYDVVQRKALLKKPLQVSIIKKIKKLYSNYELYLDTVQEKYLCKNDIVYSEIKNRRISFSEFYEAHKNLIYQLEIKFFTKKDRDNAFRELEELQLKAHFMKKDQKKDYRIIIVSNDSSKVFGLEKICKKEHLSLEQVVYVGDDEEDIPILLSVGQSAVVSNGSKKAKKVANVQTSSNETKGVEKVIKKLF